MSDYPTCAETYVTLRIFHDALEPPTISELLGITPTRSWRRGEAHGTRQVVVFPTGAWLLSSESAIASQDSVRHLDWLLTEVEPRHGELRGLRDAGHRIDISCYWVSATGQGGPTLTPDIMRRLAKLELALWFDVYFADDDTQNI